MTPLKRGKYGSIFGQQVVSIGEDTLEEDEVTLYFLIENLILKIAIYFILTPSIFFKLSHNLLG